MFPFITVNKLILLFNDVVKHIITCKKCNKIMKWLLKPNQLNKKKLKGINIGEELKL